MWVQTALSGRCDLPPVRPTPVSGTARPWASSAVIQPRVPVQQAVAGLRTRCHRGTTQGARWIQRHHNPWPHKYTSRQIIPSTRGWQLQVSRLFFLLLLIYLWSCVTRISVNNITALKRYFASLCEQKISNKKPNNIMKFPFRNWPGSRLLL